MKKALKTSKEHNCVNKYLDLQQYIKKCWLFELPFDVPNYINNTFMIIDNKFYNFNCCKII